MKNRLPESALIALIIFVSVWGYYACKRDPVFKVNDTADMAVVGRNIAEGKGFTSDAIWLWVNDWGSTHHPEDYWPPLQTYITAGFFYVFGQSVAVQKSVNICYLILMMIAVYFAATHLFGKWHGAVAAAMVLVNDRIPDLVGYGLNDIGAACLDITAIYLLYRAILEEKYQNYLIGGAIVTALAVLQKFQAAFVILAFIIYQLSLMRAQPKKAASKLAIFLVITGLIGLPLAVRNYRIWGNPSYPSMELAANLGNTWDASYVSWRRIIVYFNPYYKHQKPTYKWQIEKKGAYKVLVKRPARELWRIIKLTATGITVQMPVFLMGLLGIILSWRTHKKWHKWCLLNFATSSWFALLRGTEPRYYLFLIPLFAIPASFGVVSIIRLFSEKTKALVVAAILMSVIIVYPVSPSYLNATTLSEDAQKRDRAFINMCEFLAKNLAPDEGTVTWNAFETSFQTRRGAAMPVNTDLADFIMIADRYKLRYIVLNYPWFYLKIFNNPGSQHMMLRQLAPLYKGKDAFGFKLEFTDYDTLVYRIPRPNEVDLDALPKLPPEPDDFTLLLLEPDRGGIAEPPPPLEP